MGSGPSCFNRRQQQQQQLRAAAAAALGAASVATSTSGTVSAAKGEAETQFAAIVAVPFVSYLCL